RPLEAYTAVAVTYLLLIVPVVWLTGVLERRLSRRGAARGPQWGGGWGAAEGGPRGGGKAAARAGPRNPGPGGGDRGGCRGPPRAPAGGCVGAPALPAGGRAGLEIQDGTQRLAGPGRRQDRGPPQVVRRAGGAEGDRLRGGPRRGRLHHRAERLGQEHAAPL